MRISMTVALDMFPFGHVLFVVNDNMCTNRESDVKPALKELKFFYHKSVLWPLNRKYRTITGCDSKQMFIERTTSTRYPVSYTI